jgi:methionyl-tRNA formyltransferase
MGTPGFAVPSLEYLLRNGQDIAAVVTAPDKPRGRGQELAPTAVKTAALRHSLPMLQPDNLRAPSFVEQLREFRPDCIVVVAFRILPREVFTVPPLGAFNLHASLLPRYRGAAPIQWAIIRGETETGVTTFLLDERVDTGKILLQARIPIGQDEDAGSLHDRLAVLGAGVVVDTVRLLESGDANPLPQDQSRATPAPKIFREDCQIRWDRPAAEIRNLVRGLSPHPAAFALHRGKTIKFYRAAISRLKSTRRPGEVSVTRDSLHVATADVDIEIEELQQEGRSRMQTGEFLRGYKIESGERFGE